MKKEIRAVLFWCLAFALSFLCINLGRIYKIPAQHIHVQQELPINQKATISAPFAPSAPDAPEVFQPPAVPGPPPAPYVPRLVKDQHGIASYERTACQNSSVTYKDLTVYIVSSAATYHSRFPHIEKTWVAEMERRGATIVVFIGPDDRNQTFSDSRVVRTTLDVGPHGCGGFPRDHCDTLYTEHAVWLRDHVRTKLITHADDDTVFEVDRFLNVLRCLPDPSKEMWMIGDCSKMHWEVRSFCGGGASYTFTSQLIISMAACTSGYGRADDVQGSWCAMDGGATLVNHPEFHYGPEHYDNWVTAHHVRPEGVMSFYTVRNATKSY